MKNPMSKILTLNIYSNADFTVVQLQAKFRNLEVDLIKEIGPFRVHFKGPRIKYLDIKLNLYYMTKNHQASLTNFI